MGVPDKLFPPNGSANSDYTGRALSPTRWGSPAEQGARKEPGGLRRAEKREKESARRHLEDTQHHHGDREPDGGLEERHPDHDRVGREGGQAVDHRDRAAEGEPRPEAGGEQE